MSEQESLINAEQETKDEVGEVAERPEWLPEKFFKDGNPDYESLAKSYTEAESYIGKKKEDLTAEIKTQMEADEHVCMSTLNKHLNFSITGGKKG